MIAKHFLHRYHIDGRCSQLGHAPCPHLYQLYETHLPVHRQRRLHLDSNHSSAGYYSEPLKHRQVFARFSLVISFDVVQVQRHRIAISIILAYFFCSNPYFLLVRSIQTHHLLFGHQLFSRAILMRFRRSKDLN